MESPVLTVPTAGERARLDAVLRADCERERARALRNLLVAILAILGVPLWLLALWPTRGPVRSLEVAAFAVTLATLALATAWEWTCSRRRAWRIAELGPPPRYSPGIRACARDADEES